MPGHEGSAWIGTAVSSVAAQNDLGIEIILVDSSSDDYTAEAARAAAGGLPLRVKRIPEMNSWIEKTNLAVSMAAAPFVAMLHQDDVWLPGRAAAVRRWIAEQPTADLHLAPTRIIDRTGRGLGLWQCPLSQRIQSGGPSLVEALMVQNFVSVPAPVIRRDAWLACDGLDPTLWYTADWDLWGKLAAGEVYYHSDVTTGFRIHGGSLTMSGSRERADFAEQMRIVVDRYLPSGRSPIRRLAEASINVNVALARAANGGMLSGLFGAALSLLSLGPIGAVRYLRLSRIVERVLPRVRARLAGQF